ncbi:uncharacterized protein VP01_10997g1, partial [Puccinia sorghi]
HPAIQRCPGWDWVTQDLPDTKNISSNIDPENIIAGKQPALYSKVLDPVLAVAMTALSPVHLLDDIPWTYKQAMASPDARLWLLVIQEELDAMHHLCVWEIVPIEPGFFLIGTVW